MTRTRPGSGILRLAVLLFASSVAAAPPGTAVDRFGEEVVRLIRSGDGDGFTALVDREAVVDRAVSGVSDDARVAGEIREGLASGLDRVGEVLVGNLGAEARPKFVRSRTVDGVDRILVRLDLGERGLNYLDLFVHRDADGEWAIFDWIDYVQGQRYTESLRMVLATMIRTDGSLVSRILGVPDVDRAAVERVREMGRLSRERDWTGWLRAYRALPDALRDHRVLLTTRVAIAGASGDSSAYLDAMGDLAARYGDDPALALPLVDYYLLSGEIDRAFRAVDLLDRATGGDAALTNLRAGIALQSGDPGGSVRHARRAIEEDPDLEDPYWHLMVAGARAGDYAAAMDGVRALEGRFGYAFVEDELRANAEFTGLVASKEWRARR